MGQTFNSLSTLEHYLESGGQAVLYVGDLSYSDEHEFEDVGLRWDTWGRFAEKSAAYQPWFWNVGNHEVEFMPEVVTPKKFYYKICCKTMFMLMLRRELVLCCSC